MSVTRRLARLLAVILLPSVLLPAPAVANVPVRERLQIDGAGTRVEFTLRLMLVRKLEGAFPLVEGEVWLDRGAGTAEVDVRIDAREIMMERAAYAEWARSPEFFDSLAHPWVSFHARHVPLELFRDGGPMLGELTVRGVRRTVGLQVLPSTCEEPGRGCPVLASGELDRSDFGMSARRFVLGDKVRLRFEIRLQDPAGAAS